MGKIPENQGNRGEDKLKASLGKHRFTAVFPSFVRFVSAMHTRNLIKQPLTAHNNHSKTMHFHNKNTLPAILLHFRLVQLKRCIGNANENFRPV
ncbi:hypothetical protein V8J88_06925 [Massilia sp. W12]|uniref:hypothetical protein n=1 Tax=Massilia sp. W12 TaxID=3126507 RepID=UPI0030CC40A0